MVCRVSTDGTPAGDGSNWSDQAKDLTSALAEAACEELWLRAGVYKPVVPQDTDAVTDEERSASFVIDRQVAIYGGFEGTETARDERDPTAHATVLSGDRDGNDQLDEHGATATVDAIVGSNSLHVVRIDGTTAPITSSTDLDGVTITGGLANQTNPWKSGGDGAGLVCDGEGGTCSPTPSHLVFRGNSAVYSGGALYARGGRRRGSLRDLSVRGPARGAPAPGARVRPRRRGTRTHLPGCHPMTSLRTLALALGHAAPAMAFSWSNCPGTFPSQVELLSLLLPWQLDQPGTLQFEISLSEVIASHNDATFVVDHRVDGRRLPCLEPLVGSCTYANVCSLLEPGECAVNDANPQIPCTCPFNRGTYLVSAPGVELKPIEHAELLLGSNEVRIIESSASGGTGACIDMSFEVVRCEEPPCEQGQQGCEPRYCLQ